MKVVLATASFPTTYTVNNRFLGLGYIHAHALAEKSIADRVTVTHEKYNVFSTEASKIAESILTFSPDLVGFGCYVWNTVHVLEIVKHLKAKAPNVKVILGGPEVEVRHLEVFEENPGVDYISLNEGEETFRDLLHALLGEKPVDQVKGLTHRTKNGVVINERRPKITDLDYFESPYLTGVLDIDDITKGATFQTSRGCPFECAYCDYGRSHPYEEFSLERVYEELEFFQERDTSIIFATDAIFNMNVQRATKIIQTMIDRSMTTRLWVEAHPRLMTEEFVEAMGKLTLTMVGMGIQTTNPVAMKNIAREWDPVKIGELLDKVALNKNCYLNMETIMGLPGDNLQGYKDTLSWAYSKSPASVYPFILQIFPQTPLHCNIKKFGIVKEGADKHHQIISNDTFSAEEIQVGLAMTHWIRQLQALFYRMYKLTDIPAGDLIEEWAWYAYHEKLHEALDELHNNQVEDDVLDNLADHVRKFSRSVFERANQPDLSLHMKEFVRYYYLRRAVTKPDALFYNTQDIQSITINPNHNRFIDKKAFDGKPLPDDARKGEFQFDMQKLWCLITLEEFKNITPEQHTYIFFTDENGAALTMET